MDHIEIIIKDIKNSKIENVFFDIVSFDKKDIISSHFFDKEKNKDVEFQNIRSLKEYFNIPGTCNIYFKKVMLGTELEDVLVLIACDENYGEISVDFEEEQFKKYSNQEMKNKLKMILTLLLELHRDGKTEEIILGYEPAEDADMKILEISQKQIRIFNENVFNTSLAREIFKIVKEIK